MPADDLGAPVVREREPAGADGAAAIRVGTSLGDAERQLILATLEHCAGDKKKAAEVLGISLKTLYNRLNVYKRD